PPVKPPRRTNPSTSTTPRGRADPPGETNPRPGIISPDQTNPRAEVSPLDPRAKRTQALDAIPANPGPGRPDARIPPPASNALHPIPSQARETYRRHGPGRSAGARSHSKDRPMDTLAS